MIKLLKFLSPVLFFLLVNHSIATDGTSTDMTQLRRSPSIDENQYVHRGPSIPKGKVFTRPSPIGKVNRDDIKFDRERGSYYTGQSLSEFPKKEEREKIALETH